MSETETTAPEGRVARRRARVRERILRVAERLMSKRGVDEVTIDDITEAADISRRSFYHYFESKHDVLVPIARERTRSLNEAIDRLVATIDDPAEVLATAMRHGLRSFTRDPLCAWFVLHSGLPHERLLEGLDTSGMRDVRAGIEAGRFRITNARVLRPFLSGAFIAVAGARIAGQLGDTDLDDSVEHMLLLLSLSKAEAHDIAHRPLRPLAGTGSDD